MSTDLQQCDMLSETDDYNDRHIFSIRSLFFITSLVATHLTWIFMIATFSSAVVFLIVSVTSVIGAVAVALQRDGTILFRLRAGFLFAFGGLALASYSWVVSKSYKAVSSGGDGWIFTSAACVASPIIFTVVIYMIRAWTLAAYERMERAARCL